MRIFARALFIIVISAAPLAAQTNHAATAGSRQVDWAQKLDRPGLPNMFRVTTNLYRGAQPTAQGMAGLKEMGVKTIINLRSFHSDDSKLGATGLDHEHLKMEPWHADEEEIVRFLKIMADSNNLPVFVHCQRGADRTGTMCAMYRIVCCGWTKDEAIRELREGGFGFNPMWKNLIRYIKHADIGKLRKEAGIATRNQGATK